VNTLLFCVLFTLLQVDSEDSKNRTNDDRRILQVNTLTQNKHSTASFELHNSYQLTAHCKQVETHVHSVCTAHLVCAVRARSLLLQLLSLQSEYYRDCAIAQVYDHQSLTHTCTHNGVNA
jgi:hypothetical protein